MKLMVNNASVSDEILLSRLAAGDEASFEALYDRLHPWVFRYALRMTGSESVAEDLTQDVFIVLMRDAAKFDPERGTVGSYLFGMARNRVLRHLQRGRAFVPLSEDGHEDTADMLSGRDGARDPLAELIRSRTIESVRQAVLSLPVHYREVVVLCNLQEMNYAEAASVLECAVGTIRSRLSRAREMLSARLGAMGVTDPVSAEAPSARGTS